MLIFTTHPPTANLLNNVCMPTPNGYSVAANTTFQLSNLCAVLTLPRYAGSWSVSFTDQEPTGLSANDLLSSLDQTTEQSFLLSPGFIGADTEDLLHWLKTIYSHPVNMQNYPRVAQLFRLWYACTYPAEYQDPPEKPFDFAEWTLRHDTPSRRNARTQRRGQKVMELLSVKGWNSQSEMITAMLNCRVEVPENPERGDI